MRLGSPLYASCFVLGLVGFGGLLIGGLAHSIREERALPALDLSYPGYIARLDAEGDTRAALEQMRLAIDLDVESGREVVPGLIRYAKRHGDVEGELAALRWRARRHARHLRPHVMLARALLDLPGRDGSRLDEAEERARAALAIDEGAAQAHFELGSVLRFRGDDARARDHWQRALELAPERRPRFAADARRRHGDAAWPPARQDAS